MLDFASLFRPLAERSQVVYFVYQLETKEVAYVSAAYETVLGRPREAASQDLPALLARLHPDDQSYAAARLAHLLQGKFVEDVELRLMPAPGRAGQPQWLCVTVGRVEQAPGQTYLSGTVQDITQTREYIDNADRFNKKKNTTLEILSHDLAGPFIMIKQVAGYLGERIESLQDAQLSELLHSMQTTCQDSINLIRDFVDNEFLESSGVKMKLERVNLTPLLQEIVQQLQKPEAGLGKQFSFAGPETCYLHLDHNKFMQVVNNLLSNSIKFTPDGGHIRTEIQDLGHEVLVIIKDTGIGISKEMQDVLFERFTPARRPGLRGEKTTGLGMSIIKTIVELHGGRIWFESSEDNGSTFFIALPRMEPEN
ncbi:two-component system sensor histidine kinase VicK [Hymenobacter luteus]|uniref:histidine kinase n=2 Tax=Hymenobacter TaxID=89966 RepID=A0A7W9T396_9BACT|nr:MULTISPECIES: PAS domain-containing sensor histidine kinase [Hymenobacter]MBB4603267.1 two-component system sensor histidine kinase VicK [Hymenobacter latericoloratus]MBB6060165.1 two-component system sensor histidine kinase VicK [Hymenobacter luteus]